MAQNIYAVRSAHEMESPDYLDWIGRIPLLTAEQELALGRRIEQGRQAHSRLMQDNVSPDDREMLERQEGEGRAAQQQFVEANLRLVVSIAKKYVGLGLPHDDLCQEGNIGLMAAVDRWECDRGCRFATYATWWIRQTMLRAIRTRGRSVRLPDWMHGRLSEMKRIADRLTQELGREPTNDEIAKGMGISARQMERLRRFGQSILSLDAPVGNSEDLCWGDHLPDAEQSFEDRVIEEQSLAGDVVRQYPAAKAAALLTPKQLRVLQLRYGLEDGIARTLAATGQILGLTRERIRQIESIALGKLREHCVAPASSAQQLSHQE